LVPAPKYDPTQENTFLTFQNPATGIVTFVYIGTDNKVYTYGSNIGVYQGANITTPQQIILPAGVSAVKVMGPFYPSFALILGSDGIIYRCGHGGTGFSGTGATGLTAQAHTPSTYNFKDFIIDVGGSAFLGIIGVPKVAGNDMVKLRYDFTGGGVGYSITSTKTLVGTSRFNAVKLWGGDTQDNVVFKDGNTGNSYVMNQIGINRSTDWVTLSIGFTPGNAGSTNNDPNGASLKYFGPFKMINCLD
jgi:hypothetical protein